MTDCFVKDDLFTPVQFGFRSGHSCVYAVSEIFEYIRNAMDKKFTMFYRPQKSFWIRGNSQLLNKLYNVGFRRPIFHHLSDYLTNT